MRPTRVEERRARVHGWIVLVGGLLSELTGCARTASIVRAYAGPPRQSAEVGVLRLAPEGIQANGKTLELKLPRDRGQLVEIHLPPGRYVVVDDHQVIGCADGRRTLEIDLGPPSADLVAYDLRVEAGREYERAYDVDGAILDRSAFCDAAISSYPLGPGNSIKVVLVEAKTRKVMDDADWVDPLAWSLRNEVVPVATLESKGGADASGARVGQIEEKIGPGQASAGGVPSTIGSSGGAPLE